MIRRDAPLLAACPGRCGLASCFGASTVTVGMVEEPVAVCDTAVPLSNEVDKKATARGAIKPEDNLIIMSSRIQDGQPVPTIHGTQASQNFRIRPLAGARNTNF
jgi:hypothetical protein